MSKNSNERMTVEMFALYERINRVGIQMVGDISRTRGYSWDYDGSIIYVGAVAQYYGMVGFQSTFYKENKAGIDGQLYTVFFDVNQSYTDNDIREVIRNGLMSAGWFRKVVTDEKQT